MAPRSIHTRVFAGQQANQYSIHVICLCVEAQKKYADEFTFTSPVQFACLSLIGWLVVLFYGIITLFGSFNTKLNFKQFTLV